MKVLTQKVVKVMNLSDDLRRRNRRRGAAFSLSFYDHCLALKTWVSHDRKQRRTGQCNKWKHSRALLKAYKARRETRVTMWRIRASPSVYCAI